MMDVFKCLKLDASLQAGQGRQADWLKQKLGKGACVSAVEGFFLAWRSLLYCLRCCRRVLKIDNPCCANGHSNEMQIISSCLFQSYCCLYVALTELTRGTSQKLLGFPCKNDAGIWL